MSDNINVISINPGRKSFGEINFELPRINVSEEIISKSSSKTRHFRSFINFLTGINPGVTTKWSIKILTQRLIAGGTLIAAGIMDFNGFLDFDLPTVMIITGALVLSGLFTRIASAIGGIAFGAIAVLSYLGIANPYLPTYPISAGEINFAYVLYAGLLLNAMISGPGRFSIDQLIRSGAFALRRRSIKNNIRKAHRKAELRMSYKAFQYS